MPNPHTNSGLSIETINDPISPAISPWGDTEIVLKGKQKQGNRNKSVTIEVHVDETNKTATATVTSVNL
jgi:hypothetical protein